MSGSPLRYETAGPEEAQRVLDLYLATPAYFTTLSIPMPSVDEVRTDLATAAATDRRWTELVLAPDPDGGAWRDVGYLDVTLDNLAPGDASVNLLLVRADRQREGIGRAAVADLERRLGGRCRRVLAGVYGKDPASRRFWTSMGFHFAIDARPVLEWYAKRLGGEGTGTASGAAVLAGADLPT